MGLNSETNKKGNVLVTKTILAIFLLIVAMVVAYWLGLTPCKVVISLSPGIQFCQPEPSPSYVVVSVRADMAWQNTNILINSGQTLNIVASGSINTWEDRPESYSPSPDGNSQSVACPSEGNVPDCLINGELYGTLIGKIGENGTPFRIGAKNTIPISASGYLFLAINDDEPYYDDNSGSYSVSISVK